jgi:VCBS repeat-containing protein
MVDNNVGTASQQVSTTASTPPIGALLNLNLKVTPPADPDDHISRELLRGLPPGTVISDGSGGHSLTVTSNGEVNVLTDLNGWQHIDKLSAQLPSGYRQNLPLQLVVETTGPDGAISRVTSDTSVLFDPSAQTPALPPLAAPADVDQAPTVAAGSETINEDNSYNFKPGDFGYGDRDGDVLHHLTVTSLPPASEGQLLLGGVVVHAGQEIPAARLGELSFQPAKDFNGDSHFGFSASDGSKDSAAAQMSVHVNPVADQTTAELNVGQDLIKTTDFDLQGALGQSGHGGLELHAFGVGSSPIDPATGRIDPKHLQDTAALQITPEANHQFGLGILGGKSSITQGQPTFLDAGGHNINQGKNLASDDSQINQGESLLVTLPALANSAQLTLNSFSNEFVSNDHLIWHAYDANGQEVATGELSTSKVLGGPVQRIHNLEIHTPQPFAHLLITAGAPSASTGYSARAQAGDKSAFSVQNVMTQLIVHTTELKLGAHFASDYQGQGESVGYRITGLSEEAKLDHGTRQSDGSWLVTAQEAGQLHLLHTREQHLSVTAITHDGSSERSSAPLSVDVAPIGSTYEVISGRHAGDVFEMGSADRLETGGSLQVDSSSGASPSFLPQTISNAYGTFAVDIQGRWHFQVDTHSQATQALRQDEMKELPFSVSTSDGLQQQVMVHLIGQDTPPVIGGVLKGDVTEDQAGKTESSGHINFTDPDTVESLGGGKFSGSSTQAAGTISATGPTTIHGKYGDLVIQPNGDWAYHLDHTKADPLRSGQVEKEVFGLTPVEHRLIGGVVDNSNSFLLIQGALKVEIAVHGSDEGVNQVGGISSTPAGSSPLPSPPPPAPGSQQSQELQDLLQQLQSSGLDVSETQAATTHQDHDPLTGASRDILELHTAHGIVVQTLSIHSDGSQQVDLDTTRLDGTAQAALPAHSGASSTSQPLTSLDQKADDPDQPASSVNVMDQSLVAPELHLDPMALQDAVRSVGFDQAAPPDSSLPTTDQQSADLSPDLLAHAIQELSTSPIATGTSNGDGSGNGQDLGWHSVPVSTDPDPFAATTSDPVDADADNTATPLPPVEPPQEQNLDHLATL